MAEVVAMLSTLSPDAEIDFTLRSVRTARQGAVAEKSVTKSSAERMRELRDRRELERMRLEMSDGPPSRGVTLVTKSDESDAKSDATLTGGIQGGSGSGSADQISEEAETKHDSGSGLTGQDPERAPAAAKSDAVASSSDASPSHLVLSSPEKPKQRRRGSVRSSFPGWPAPLAEHRVYAAEKGWPAWWLANRFERFCALAQAKGWIYSNWSMALYTFLRAEIDEYNRGPQQLAHLAPRAVVNGASAALSPEAEERRRRAAEAEAKVLGKAAP